MLLTFLLNELLMAGVKDIFIPIHYPQIGLRRAHVMMNLHWTRGGAASRCSWPADSEDRACRVAL